MELEHLKNRYEGRRCFIVATGPSLNKTNLNLIKDEILFGVNTLYKGYDKLGINCQFYGVSDAQVILNHYKGIVALDTILFISGGAARLYYQMPMLFSRACPTFILPEIGIDKFSKDITKGLYNGQTIVFDIILQVAYYMGFDKVYLIGCDSDYTAGHHFDGSKADTMEGGAAGNWQRVHRAFKLAKEIYEENDREILNATVGGKLEIFKRVQLEDIV